MNVAQLSMRYPPGPGGVERHVAEVSPRLVARGHRVTVYTSDLYSEFPLVRLDPSVPRDERTGDLRVRRLKVISLPSELHYPFFRGLGRALADDLPELLHVHTYGTHHAAVARRFARRHRVPWVMTAHFHPIWSIHGGWLRHRIRGFYDRRLAGPIVRDAARLIVQSQEEERLLRELGIQLPPTVVIPPGFAPLPPPLDDPKAFGRTIGVDGPFVLFVGRLASNKGLIPLVQAFAELRSHDPSAQLVLVGEDGGMASAVTAEAERLGITQAVHLTGFLRDERLLASAFREARMFALPSEYEAFGLVLLEALAHGTPVIASRVGGIPEFIEDGKAGLLVAPEDPADIARAFMLLWDNEPRRRELGEFGRTQVVPRFSWDALAERLDRLYAEVRSG